MRTNVAVKISTFITFLLSYSFGTLSLINMEGKAVLLIYSLVCFSSLFLFLISHTAYKKF